MHHYGCPPAVPARLSPPGLLRPCRRPWHAPRPCRYKWTDESIAEAHPQERLTPKLPNRTEVVYPFSSDPLLREHVSARPRQRLRLPPRRLPGSAPPAPSSKKA
jgi:hypothetical protein